MVSILYILLYDIPSTLQTIKTKGFNMVSKLTNNTGFFKNSSFLCWCSFRKKKINKIRNTHCCTSFLAFLYPTFGIQTSKGWPSLFSFSWSFQILPTAVLSLAWIFGLCGSFLFSRWGKKRGEYSVGTRHSSLSRCKCVCVRDERFSTRGDKRGGGSEKPEKIGPRGARTGC